MTRPGDRFEKHFPNVYQMVPTLEKVIRASTMNSAACILNRVNQWFLVNYRQHCEALIDKAIVWYNFMGIGAFNMSSKDGIKFGNDIQI